MPLNNKQLSATPSAHFSHGSRVQEEPQVVKIHSESETLEQTNSPDSTTIQDSGIAEPQHALGAATSTESHTIETTPSPQDIQRLLDQIQVLWDTVQSQQATLKTAQQQQSILYDKTFDQQSYQTMLSPGTTEHPQRLFTH